MSNSSSEPAAAEIEKLIEDLLAACNYYERAGYGPVKKAHENLIAAVRQLAAKQQTGDKLNALDAEYAELMKQERDAALAELREVKGKQ